MADFSPGARPSPTLVSNFRGPEDHVSTRVKIDMSDKILWYAPEATPFLTLTGKIKGKRKAFNYKYEWLEKDQKPRALIVDAAQTETDTSVEVDAGNKVVARDVLLNTRTREVLLVSSVSSNTLTVVRGIGGAGVAMNDGDTLLLIGSSYADGAASGTPVSITEFSKYNYTQIFRTPFAFTGRDLETELFGGNDKMTETKWQAIEHKRSIEYAFYFGKRALIAAAGGVHQATFTGGLDQAIQSNAWDVSGVTLNTRTFNEFLEEALRWGKGGRLQGGSATKYLLCSSPWLTEINSWAENKLEYRVLDKEIGFSAMEYKSPHGRVMLLSSAILDEYHPDRAYLVDFNHVDYVYLRNRDTKLLSKREDNDIDGEKYEYFSDCGLQVEFEQSHAVLTGLTV
jgi:hypothetical protein